MAVFILREHVLETVSVCLVARLWTFEERHRRMKFFGLGAADMATCPEYIKRHIHQIKHEIKRRIHEERRLAAMATCLEYLS